MNGPKRDVIDLHGTCVVEAVAVVREFLAEQWTGMFYHHFPYELMLTLALQANLSKLSQAAGTTPGTA